MASVFIGVGSNIQPEKNIPRALRLLAAEVSITGLSTFYLSEAVDRPGQPLFFNGVVWATSECAPAQLKQRVLRKIEKRLGRKRTADKSAPRPIDLDILIYGDRVIDANGLTIPDPLIASRPFLAIPLLELAPDLVLPDSRRALSEIVRAMRPLGMKPLGEFSQALKKELGHEP